MTKIEVIDPKLGDREAMRFECLRLAGGDLRKAQELVNFVEGRVSYPVLVSADSDEGKALLAARKSMDAIKRSIDEACR